MIFFMILTKVSTRNELKDHWREKLGLNIWRCLDLYDVEWSIEWDTYTNLRCKYHSTCFIPWVSRDQWVNERIFPASHCVRPREVKLTFQWNILWPFAISWIFNRCCYFSMLLIAMSDSATLYMSRKKVHMEQID